MGSEAFDQLLSRLDSEDRERIHEMAMAYGLTFDDPSWVPFAVTQMTLDVLKAEVDEAVDEIEKAADRALRRIGSNAQSVSSQVQIMAEAQTAAFEGFRKAALAREHEATARYQVGS